MNRAAGLCSLIALLIGLLAPCARPQASGALSPEVTRESVTVGEPLTYSVEVPLAPDEAIVGPGPDADFAPWEVRGYDEAPLEGKTRLTYQLALFETGEQTIPGIEIRIQKADGQARTVKTAAVRGKVASVLKEGDEQPADIRQPVALREKPVAIALRVLIAVALGALLVGAVWLVWRRRRTTAAQLPQAPEAPDVVALRALRKLGEMQLPEQGEVKRHYTALSDVLRGYISARYGVRSLEETTSAIVAGLQASPEATDYVARFEDLLREADLVKFAKARPAVAACYGALEAAADLVRETAAVSFSPVEEAGDELR